MQRRRPGLAIVQTPERGSLEVRAIRFGTRGGMGATQQVFADLSACPLKPFVTGNSDGASQLGRRACFCR